MANPLLVAGAITAGSALLGGFFPDERGKLMDEVLQSELNQLKRLERISRGEDMATNRAIRQNAENAAAAVQPSLASRGISRSPASARVVQTAAVQGANQAQLAALGLIPQQQQALSNLASQLPTNDDIFGQIQAIGQSYAMLQAFGQSKDPYVDATLKHIYGQMAGESDLATLFGGSTAGG